MSLYEYDLYLIRELEKGEILPEIINLGLLQTIDDDEVAILGEINCFFSEVINQIIPSCPLRIVKLELDGVQFEQFIGNSGQVFISWLKEVVKKLDIAYSFIGGGASAAYYKEGGITSEKIFRQIGNLIETGKVEIVHPVMFFSKRIGIGKICDLAKKSPYTVCEMPRIGCLILLIDGNIQEGKIEILDPGIIYSRLLKSFQQ